MDARPRLSSPPTALGFKHEQQRADRDKYLKINTGNIKPDKMNNFKKLSLSSYSHWSTPYDYGSIMHYSKTAFGKKRGLITMQPKKSGVSIGQRKNFSKNDIAAMKRMYKC